MNNQPAMSHLALPNVPGVGDIIAEKYRIEGILGVGGMGVVLNARHLQLGQTVAIKVLCVGKDNPQDAVERFLREGRAAAALTCDHVVRIYDVGQLQAGTPFMVMERLRGKDLATVLRELGPMSVGDAVEYVAQATLAIAEAHEAGIVHRDLKPSNLFLTSRSDGSPCIKVLDFGISKYLSETDAETLHGALTSTRQVMGSPAYMSPEQVRDAKAVDHRTDIWALGVTLYELLTHCPAFDADTLPAICAAIAADTPVPVRVKRPDVPSAVETIVSRCLEKAPTDRFRSARGLLTALRGWQGKTVEPIPLPGDRRGTSIGAFDSASRRERKAQESSADLPDREAKRSDGTLISGKGPALWAALRAAPDTRTGTGQIPESAAERRPASDPRVGRARSNSAANLTTGRITAAVQGSGEISIGNGSSAGSGRYRSLLSMVGLALAIVGAAASWLSGRGAATSGFNEGRRSAAVRQGSVAPEMPIEPPGVPVATSFLLRLESTPDGATVLEADRVLGVTPLSLRIERSEVRGSARDFVVRKRGFVDATVRQQDSATDVRRTVSLANEPTAAEPSPAKSPAAPTATRISPKPGHSSLLKNTSPAVTTPQIRTTR